MKNKEYNVLDKKGIMKNFKETEIKREDIAKNNEKLALKVSFFSLCGNALLSAFKLVAGLVGKSYAMLADSIHSFSDVFTTIIVIAGVKISAKKADKEHPYGHDRYECVAALLLSFALFVVGAMIGYSAITKLINGSYKTVAVPELIALIAAVVSIAEQCLMFVVTIKVAKKINSGALKADAWHHLSDSLSSVGSFVGILGAMLGCAILDIIAGLLICVLIIKVAYDVFMDSVNKMTDKATDAKTEEKIRKIAQETDGVIVIDRLRTRQFGNMIYIDLEIACDPSLTLVQAHDIAQNVHDNMEREMSSVKHCLVHVNPYDEETETKYAIGEYEKKF